MHKLRDGLMGIALSGILAVSGCSGRTYLGANDPKLNYTQNKNLTEQRIEDNKRIYFDKDNKCQPLTFISYKFK